MSKSERKSFQIGETKEKVFTRDRYTCQNCGGSIHAYGTPQLAHLIPQSEVKHFGEQIIHHPDNLRSACSLRCNNAMQVNAPELQNKIARSIVFNEDCLQSIKS